jgi:hypothetical protein
MRQIRSVDAPRRHLRGDHYAHVSLPQGLAHLRPVAFSARIPPVEGGRDDVHLCQLVRSLFGERRDSARNVAVIWHSQDERGSSCSRKHVPFQSQYPPYEDCRRRSTLAAVPVRCSVPCARPPTPTVGRARRGCRGSWSGSRGPTSPRPPPP